MSSATTTPSPSDDGDFFDDDNNKAMYLVLPAMILIYGSCCLVYCIHKCRRYCVHKTKKKRKEEKKRLMKKEGISFENGALSLHDETNQGRTSRVITLENMEEEGGHQQRSVAASNGRSSRMCQETDVDSLEDVLQTESVSAVSPGYQGATLRQEMQHLDNQLKAAFRLSDRKPKGGSEGQGQGQGEASQQPALKTRSGATQQTRTRSDVIQAYMEWKALQKTQPPKLDVRYTPSGDTVVVRIPKEKRLKMIQEQKEAQALALAAGSASATPTVHPQEADVNAILDIRKKINKPLPKSMPDILRGPDENGVVLKKLSTDTKRRIYLSSQ